jgi:hypothetical protein
LFYSGSETITVIRENKELSESQKRRILVLVKERGNRLREARNA